MIPSIERYPGTEMTLGELVDALRALLEHAVRVPADGRISGLPDARTLRYYQAIGLLDKPLRYDGRRAVYGYTHLLQALNVKALQSQGFSLAQIRRRLAGASRVDLERTIAEIFGPVAAPELEDPVLHPGITQEYQPSIVSPTNKPDSRALIAVEVGRGVSVVIDPALVDSPEVILAAVTELLNAIK